MADPHHLARRPVTAAVLAALAGLGAGCGERDGINSYRVPRETEATARAEPRGEPRGEPKLPPGHTPIGGGSGQRILGAVYPADKPVWFFKLTGPADQVERYAADFDKLARTVRLRGDAVPAFTLPDGWALGGPKTVTRDGFTFKFDETVKLGPPAAPLEITISQSGGGLAMNLNRWAAQVGLPGVRPGEFAKYTKEFDADGVKGLRVDLQKPAPPAP